MLGWISARRPERPAGERTTRAATTNRHLAWQALARQEATTKTDIYRAVDDCASEVASVDFSRSGWGHEEAWRSRPVKKIGLAGEVIS